jgi:hypothetical protein
MGYFCTISNFRSKFFQLIFTCYFLTACSSIDKVTYYKFEDTKKNSVPKLSYEQTTMFDSYASSLGFPLKIIYNKKFRIFQINQYQYAQIKFQNYGYKIYTLGPVLLPIIPNVGDWLKSNRTISDDAKIEFSLSFSSDSVFETVTASLPDLEIVDHKGQLLRPTITVDNNDKTYSFEAKVNQTPWFILKEANILLSNGRSLTIPETKFILDSHFKINWLISIGP